MRKFWDNEEGTTLIEYSIIAVVMTVVLMAVMPQIARFMPNVGADVAQHLW